MSIGFYIFDAVPSVDKPLVPAHAKLNEGIKGYFYVRESDCKDVSSVSKGDEFFGVLDDASGYGACLFIKGLDTEANTFVMENNAHVKGDLKVDGNTTINGDLTVNLPGQISGMASKSMIQLDPSHTALIVAAGLSGSPAPLANVIVNLGK